MSIFRRKVSLPFEREHFLSLLSGSEGGISTTSAIIIGLAAVHQNLRTISASTLIIVFVQAFNSSASRYSSLKTSEEIDGIDEIKRSLPLTAAMIQFTVHITFGLLPLTPLWLYGIGVGVWISAGLTVLILVLISLYKIKYVKKNALADSVETVLVGVLVMLVGLSAGLLVEG